MSVPVSSSSSDYKFPVIDLTDWEKNRSSLASQIDEALRHVGFACYTNPPIEWDKVNKCFQAFRHYFSKDMEWKQKQTTPYGVQKNGFLSNKFSSVPWKKQSPDSKEFYKLYTNINLSDIETSTGEPIPQQLQQMDTIVNEFRTQTYQLIDIFSRLHSLALKQPEEWLQQVHGNNGTSIRCNHYPIVSDFTPTPDETQQQQLSIDLGKQTSTATEPVYVRNAAHTDLNTLTLLFLEANDPGGLEIWDDKISCWRPMTFLKNSIIVNTGKMMVRWTNDQYQANIHRVVGTKESCLVDRYSIAVFITPERTSVIKPLVPEGEKPHYEDITVGAFIDQLNKRTE